jgi:signal transduction histidine kinase/ligand-binding sensor domain-containing protein
MPDTLANFSHRAWRLKDGAPPDIWALAQSSDGCLWLGTGSGLYRFDGITFEHFRLPVGQYFPSTNITALTILPSGDMWIGYYAGGLSRLTSDGITNFDTAQGLPAGWVSVIAVDPTGTVWAAMRSGLARFANGRWERIGVNMNLHGPSAAWLTIDSRGAIWVANGESVEVLFRGADAFAPTGVRSSMKAVIKEAPDGVMWLSDTVQGTRPITSSDGALLRPDLAIDMPPALMSLHASRMIYDQHGALWASEYGVGGAVKQTPAPVLSIRRGRVTATADISVFGTAAGLTSDVVTPLLEDQEGNIWVGTNLGLNQFRHRSFFAVTGLASKPASGIYGLANDGGDGVVMTASGTVFRGNGLTYERILSTLPLSLPVRNDTDGNLWLSDTRSLWRYRAGLLQKIANPVITSSTQLIEAVTTDAANTLWVSIQSHGVFMFRGDSWTPLTPRPFGVPNVIVNGPAGEMWFGFTENRVELFDSKSSRSYSSVDGLSVGNVTTVYAQNGEVIVAGDAGIAVLSGAKFRSLSPSQTEELTSVSGIVETSDGHLWLNGAAGVVRISKQELQKALDNSEYRPIFSLFDSADGLPGVAVRDAIVPTALVASDGKLWFETNQGIVWVDPNHLDTNPSMPHLIIRSITADEKTYDTHPNPPLPKGTKSIEIAYSAASLTFPERMRFRYRLDGVDDRWRDAGSRRRAFYTNLAPGTYKFHVISASNDGVWNETGAAFAFDIPPAFVQTKWFLAICVAAGMLVLWLLWTLRLQQVQAKMRDRLEQRVLERERIAQELHDTLLQGLLSASLQLAVANSEMSPGTTAKPLVERVSQLLREMIDEGRDALRSLRTGLPDTDDDPEDLERAFAQMPQDLAADEKIKYQLIVEGTPRSLRPLIREEVYRIGREALANAFHHSHASVIETVLDYAQDHFRIVIRDNGRGMDPEVLRSGREGHWGLSGMRERSERIDGKLRVRSAVGAGTEIDLTVPAATAFEPSASGGFKNWLARLYSRGEKT